MSVIGVAAILHRNAKWVVSLVNLSRRGRQGGMRHVNVSTILMRGLPSRSWTCTRDGVMCLDTRSSRWDSAAERECVTVRAMA